MSKPISKRSHRLADLIQRQLALLLKQSTKDPRFVDVNLTAVEMNSDLSQARVYFTLVDFEQGKEVERALTRASGHLRHLLSQTSALRYTPKLHFMMDQTLMSAERITELLKEAGESDGHQ